MLHTVMWSFLLVLLFILKSRLGTTPSLVEYYFSCCIFLPVHVRFFLVRIYPSALFSMCAFFHVRFFPSALFSHALIYLCAFFRCAFSLCAFFQCAFFRSPLPIAYYMPRGVNVRSLTLNIIFSCKNFNTLSIKCQSYPKSRKIDASEQTICTIADKINVSSKGVYLPISKLH